MQSEDKIMKLTSDKALEILEKYRGKTESDMWIEHCICVGNTDVYKRQAFEHYFFLFVLGLWGSCS